jgi:hypothetical protein
MKFGHHHCSRRQSPVAVPELTSEVIRQEVFLIFLQWVFEGTFSQVDFVVTERFKTSH